MHWILLLILLTQSTSHGHDFSPVFQAEAEFHGEESSHARALALQRSKRAFYTADLQKTAESELLPGSASIHLVITISLLFFQVGGYALAGISQIIIVILESSCRRRSSYSTVPKKRALLALIPMYVTK